MPEDGDCDESDDGDEDDADETLFTGLLTLHLA
jgi:hypothetical protein